MRRSDLFFSLIAFFLGAVLPAFGSIAGTGSRSGTSRLEAAYASQDHLGSMRLLTDGIGRPVERTSWGAWGELLQGGAKSRFGFTGHQTERASGHRYSVHRYLDPRNGRWTQRDPGGSLDGWNLYSYVRNNPVRFRDPSGLMTEGQLEQFVQEVVGGQEGLENFLAAEAILSERAAPIGMAAGLGAAIASLLAGGEAAWSWILQNPATARLVGAALADAMAPGSGSGILNAPNVFGSRGGVLNPGTVDEIRDAMLAGKYRFDAPEGQIGGYIDDAGNFIVNEGHHRVRAAMETGKGEILQELLDKGRWTRTPTPPEKFPIPPRGCP